MKYLEEEPALHAEDNLHAGLVVIEALEPGFNDDESGT